MAAFAAVGTVRFPDTQRLLSCSKPTDDAVFTDRQMPTLIHYRYTANECPFIGRSGQTTGVERAAGIRHSTDLGANVASNVSSQARERELPTHWRRSGSRLTTVRFGRDSVEKLADTAFGDLFGGPRTITRWAIVDPGPF